jgi:ubiquinol-cytochrome c reductase cytochrome c1 subunit
MRELKILGIVSFFVLLAYIGVHTYAYSIMIPKVAPADFTFKDLPKNTKVADASRGAEAFMNAGCIGCHGVQSQGFEAPMSSADATVSFGVVPPDLSTAGLIYDSHFLANLIKNPAKAMNNSHKFNDDNPHPMPPFFGSDEDVDQEIADMVVYLKSIAPTEEVSNEQVYIDACMHCHSIKYTGLLSNKDPALMAKYMGKIPPDLSMHIKSRGRDFLETFINDPQKHLKATAMPRVGLTQKAQNQVIDYMEFAGDRKKEQRESLGVKVLIFMFILTILAYLWKVKIWREVH